MSVTVSVQPTEEPMTLEEVKDFLRVDHDHEDSLIASLITAARVTVEDTTQRRLVNTTMIYTLDAFPVVIRPPYSPLSSVTSIQYIDEDGDTQTVDADDYTVDTSTEPGRIVEAYGASWPTTRGVIDAVTVTYVVGYGSSREDVDERAKAAMRFLISHWYENRMPVGNANTERLDVPMTASFLMQQITVPEIR